MFVYPFLFVNFLKTVLKRVFFRYFLFLNNSKNTSPKIGKGMVRVRGIFQSYDVFHKRDNKKTRSLDKVPKLRAFSALSYLSDNCSWLREPDLN